MSAEISRAITAYEHCARLVEGRLAISGRVQGEDVAAVTRVLDPIARQFRECAAALKRSHAVELAVLGEGDD